MKVLMLSAFAVLTLGSIANAQYYRLPYGGQSVSAETYCTDRPERCFYHAAYPEPPPAYFGTYLVPTAAGCSNAGDETARPVYRFTRRGPRLVGYECVQDNRGGGGGG